MRSGPPAGGGSDEEAESVPKPRKQARKAVAKEAPEKKEAKEEEESEEEEEEEEEAEEEADPDGESAFVRKAKGGKRKQVRQGPLYTAAPSPAHPLARHLTQRPPAPSLPPN